ncbi:SgcJ/EcaC family oxidoreductase [Chryseobacterium nematophagum]|uniref:SgcJ/EcaC family oxidoreductase n=1 Tax=Chryseobacterium nematophagum TaxID=2305228 RepID=A0A3M7TDT6_9FLAO|nr:SgcJ/EcaC family oxidoreductase [Chryseobacterium nematophagum]RNA61448.1 SgcJ/EcaC family oxidoreductase [Chryseobacterium nematophagum]
MKKFFLYVATIFVGVQCSSSSEEDFSNRDVSMKEIKNIILEEQAAWTAGDAKAYSAHFDENGLFTNIFGSSFTGYSAFLTRHELLFKGVFQGSKMDQNLTTLKIIDKEVAVVETITRISEFSHNEHLAGIYIDENGFINTRLLQILKKEKKEWKIVAYHNVDIKQGIPIP